MNCCNGNCNQGRDCPSRVAKVGRRIPRYPDLLGHDEPHRMKHLARWALVCIAAMFAVAAIVGVLHA